MSKAAGRLALLRRALLALLPLGILLTGVGGSLGLASFRAERTQPAARQAEAPWVETAPLRARDLTLDLHAGGTVRVRDAATLSPEVSGRVAYVSSQLRAGTFVPAGELLLRLDPRPYALALQANEAACALAEADLQRVSASEAHRREEVALLERRLEVALATERRLEALRSGGTSSAEQLDQARAATLDARAALRRPREVLDLLPLELARARASLANARAARDQAELDLARVELRAPFAGRVVERAVELGQVVTPGQALARVEDHHVYEVLVSFGPGELAKLGQVPAGARPSGDAAPAAAPVPARVRWSATGATWEGRLARVEGLDAATRTVRAVVELENPWGERPLEGAPLLPGAYCQVELRGRPQQGAWVVPEAALREGEQLFLLRADRLIISEVRVLHRLRGELVVAPAEPFQPNDHLVLSPLTHPVAGMQLRSRSS